VKTQRARGAEVIKQATSILMVALFFFFLAVAVKNRGDLISGLNMMSAKEREHYNIPLISKVVGAIGMFFSVSVMVLLYIDNEQKWVGWVMTALSVVALIVFALVSSIGGGKYVRKNR
jgi:uncharacterized protein YacL